MNVLPLMHPYRLLQKNLNPETYCLIRFKIFNEQFAAKFSSSTFLVCLIALLTWPILMTEFVGLMIWINQPSAFVVRTLPGLNCLLMQPLGTMGASDNKEEGI